MRILSQSSFIDIRGFRVRSILDAQDLRTIKFTFNEIKGLRINLIEYTNLDNIISISI